MCVAIPMKVIELSEFSCVAEVDGVTRSVSLMALDGVQLGDYLLIHAGLAIEKLDPLEAQKTLDLMRQISHETGL